MARRYTPKPGFRFPGPVPREALAYFRAKKFQIGFSYEDVWREEHAVAFTVAKAMELDVLRDIRDAVDQALTEGRTLRDFARDLKPALVQRGWWGRQEMTDPVTGEVRDVQLGSPRRLRTIYNANLRTARAAGQWERIQRTRTALPYLLYELGPSEVHRPEHAALAGLLLLVDDPFWSTHFPPNGWGCKCWVRQVSRPEAETIERSGVQLPGAQEEDPETGLPTGRLVRRKIPVRREAPQIATREWVNRRTGEVQRVPVGIDPGWDYNPGQVGRAVAAGRLYAEKAVAATADIRIASASSLPPEVLSVLLPGQSELVARVAMGEPEAVEEMLAILLRLG